MYAILLNISLKQRQSVNLNNCRCLHFLKHSMKFSLRLPNVWHVLVVDIITKVLGTDCVVGCLCAEKRLWVSQMFFTVHQCWHLAKQLASSGNNTRTVHWLTSNSPVLLHHLDVALYKLCVICAQLRVLTRNYNWSLTQSALSRQEMWTMCMNNRPPILLC